MFIAYFKFIPFRYQNKKMCACFFFGNNQTDRHRFSFFVVVEKQQSKKTM